MDEDERVIPEWADKKAERVMTMFPRGDTAEIDRALLHGAFAAALCEERERRTGLLEALKTLVAVLPDAAFNEPTGGALSLAKAAIFEAEGEA